MNLRKQHEKTLATSKRSKEVAMQSELGNGLSQAGRHDPAEGSLFETVARVEHDMNDLIDAVALLGVKRCSQCRQFFRSSDPGALFDCGQLVCFACIPEWWSSLSARLGVTDRERTEGKLASWLRKYHRAEVVKETPGKATAPTDAAFQIVVKCGECAGSGKLLEGERCRFCVGFGTVRIVVPKG
jgi:hypothetical protein